MQNHFNSSKLILFLLIFFWCTGFTSPLFKLLGIFNPLVEFFIADCFGNVCHQQEEKLFTIYGIKLLVCWRCAGIYFGALGASFLSVFINKEIKVSNSLFVFSAFPMITEVIFNTSGIYAYNGWIAFSTGIIFSVITLNYILPTLENQIQRIKCSLN